MNRATSLEMEMNHNHPLGGADGDKGTISKG